MSTTTTPLPKPPTSVPAIEAQELSLALPRWDAHVAYKLGTALHTRLLAFPSPCVISITTPTTPPHTLFHAVTHPGTSLDNDFWVARKRNAVIRWGCSTWKLRHVFGEGDEQVFRRKTGMGEERAGEYAIHGGGVPVRVQACEGVCAVVVVSGLAQGEDHMVVCEGLEGVRGELEGGN